ncbi:MAG: TonB family protein [Kiritimatiellae bacterium]|nr:TonB family protein [Kiritimatiellia bacterium]
MDIEQVEKRASKISLLVHGCIVVGLIIATLISDITCFTKKPDDAMLIEFTVDVSSSQDNEEPVEDLVNEPEPAPEPEPEVAPDPDPVPQPPKQDKPKRKPIKISDKVVQINQPKVTKNKPSKVTKKNDLTPEEIEKLLKMGAKPSDHTSVPGERERCLAIVYNKLYDAWRRPSLSPTEVAKPAELTIWLGDSGVIKKYKLTRSSGNRELDASVESAAKAVRRIPGLTSDFIKEYKTITINFVLE